MKSMGKGGWGQGREGEAGMAMAWGLCPGAKQEPGSGCRLHVFSPHQDHGFDFAWKPLITDSGCLGRRCPCVRAEGGKGEPRLEAVGWGGQALSGKSQGPPSFPLLCFCQLLVHLTMHFDKKNGPPSSPKLQPNKCGHTVRKSFLSGSGDSRRNSIWLFLWMAAIKRKVQNAELGSWDPRRNLESLLKIS